MWLNRHAENLTERFGPRLALIERADRKYVTVEISCFTLGEAQELILTFGGTATKLRRDWLTRLSDDSKNKPLRIGSRLVILRSKPKRKFNCRTVIIPAETAFGTGDHATTAMCLRVLERLTRERESGWTMLDAGTGTGILAIAAACFGAGHVLAIDSDPIACKAVTRNVRANRARNIQVKCGDILERRFKEKFDIIVANLFSEILIAALPNWSRCLRSDGYVILSGILRNQEPEIIRALRRNRFSLVEVRRRGKWIALLARKVS